MRRIQATLPHGARGMPGAIADSERTAIFHLSNAVSKLRNKRK
jgi:hypothetical protein